MTYAPKNKIDIEYTCNMFINNIMLERQERDNNIINQHLNKRGCIFSGFKLLETREQVINYLDKYHNDFYSWRSNYCEYYLREYTRLLTVCKNTESDIIYLDSSDFNLLYGD